MLKHIGKMTNTGSRVVVAFKTVPGEPENCLVISSDSLTAAWHDSLMVTVESPEGQDAFDLAEVLNRRMFNDGEIMLTALHKQGLLRKAPTANVTMVPGGANDIQLDKLNEIIAEQRGITLAQLAGDAPDDMKTDESVASDAASAYTGNIVPDVEDAPGETALTNESLAADLIKQSEALVAQGKTLAEEAKRLSDEATTLDPSVKPTKKSRAKAKAKTKAA